MSEMLKPCPFCGGEASKRLFYGARYSVYCDYCDARVGGLFITEADAVEAWNTRATLDGGECEFVIEDNMNETEGMGDVWFRCTNCDTTFDYYADDWLMKQNYCPHCGFKIRKAVER